MRQSNEQMNALVEIYRHQTIERVNTSPAARQSESQEDIFVNKKCSMHLINKDGVSMFIKNIGSLLILLKISGFVVNRWKISWK